MRFSYQRNIKLYKFYVIFSQALFIWPIEILFMKEKGLSYTQIMLIDSFVALVQLIAEIPSGFLADMIGCKKSVLYGLISEILAYIVLVFSKNFYSCFIYATFLALGLSLISGADNALIYESHIEINKHDEYKQTLRQSGFLKMFVLSLVTVISSYIYTLNMYLPYLCSVIFLVLACFIIIQYKEVNTRPKEKNEEKSAIQTIEYTIEFFSNNKRIRGIILVAVLFSVIFSDTNYFLQIYMREVEFDVRYFGCVFFVCNMISAFSFKYSKNIEKCLGENTKIISAISFLIIYLTAAILYNYIGIGVLCLTRIGIATIRPLLNVAINDNLPSMSRAMLLSIVTAIIRISSAIFDPLIGMVIDNFGIKGAFIGVISICIILIFVLLKGAFSSAERR